MQTVRSPRGRAVPIALVFAGGAVGTLARAALLPAAPADWDSVLGMGGINVAGSFLLGILLSVLGGASRAASALRLLLGTGVLGGFTSYSALAAQTAGLTGPGGIAGVGAGVVTLALGVAAAVAGTVAGAAMSSRPNRGGAGP